MSRVRARARDWWAVLAFLGVLMLAGFVYVYNLSISGYANTYYAMAAQAAGRDWAAWFWGSLDPSNFITLDKPPLATMLMGLSVRVFGLSSWSILLPEAVCGVATVAVLFVIVKRSAGPVAATIAALVAALTPAAVLIFRFNNPDALLTLLLVLAAWAFMRAIEDGRLRWLVLAGLFVGLAFNTKFLQAYLVLPAFALVYAFAAPGSVRRRLIGLAVAAVSVAVFSSWWVLAVQLTPADLRPYVGGSTDGTAFQLLFGYDGFARILGNSLDGGSAGASGATGGGGPGVGFGGPPCLLRLFNTQLGGQIAWLLPFAALAAVAALVLSAGRPRTDVGRAQVLMWSLWLLVHALVFSLMTGIIHSYYVVVMAPAIAALVGIGTVELWRARGTHRALAGLALAAAIASSTTIAWLLLERTPKFLPGLATLVLAVGLGAAIVVALLALWPRTQVAARAGRAALAAAAVGMAVLFVGPAAYAADTMATAYGGGDPQAGPVTGRGTLAGFQGGIFDGRDRGSVAQAELDYLVANRGSARWIVAASSSNQAAPIQLATGEPVMAMGGFSGSDPAPTLDQIKVYVSSGALRYIVVTAHGFGSFGLGQGLTTGIGSWVRANCSPLNIVPDVSSNIYDCARAF